ncbi:MULTISPECIES: DUF4238 domain-containing protein [unclassified Paenibacillus]|uniref:DUF4238 domain-containing protein n=1 Tax=unclassified Paenibacillus TaxID=185978 RepID=UPI0030F53FA2
MANQFENKVQHWVPQCYLRQWCDVDIPKGQTPYVWLFSKDWSIQKRKAPSNIFAENELYTIDMPSGIRNLYIENGLSKLETSYSQVVSKIVKNEPITTDDQEVLSVFIVAMQARTPFQRDHMQHQWGEAYSLMEDMQRQYQDATPEQKEGMSSIERVNEDRPNFSMKEVQRIAEKPLQETLIPMIKVQTSVLLQMNLAILYSISKARFLTSDNRYVLFDPESSKRHWLYRGGIGYDTVEISLPITPRHLLLLTWRELPPHIDITRKQVELFNQRHWAYAHDLVVSNSKIDKPSWVPDQVII